MIDLATSKKRRCCPELHSWVETYDQAFADLSPEGQEIMNETAMRCVELWEQSWPKAVEASLEGE